jgi:hypothetical protein
MNAVFDEELQALKRAGCATKCSALDSSRLGSGWETGQASLRQLSGAGWSGGAGRACVDWRMLEEKARCSLVGDR